MVIFKWIKMSLFLTVLLFTAAVNGEISYTVRVGDEVTLSCENVIEGQDKCDRTTWMLGGSKNSVTLFEHGQIHKDAASQSDRLSVTENCSLVIKKVTVEDVGHYGCRQFNRSGRQQGPDAHVFLFVVSMTEQKNRDQVTLNCSVRTYDHCRHTVKWLYEGKDLDKDLKTSQSGCSANVTITTSRLITNHNLFKCNVTDKYTGNMQLFTFSLQSSDDKTDHFVLNNILLAVRVALLVLPLIVITVLQVRARGNQRPPAENMDLNSVRTEQRSGPAEGGLGK
ncbi:uncharacterized protein LOC127142638 [Lates calcarifer]|uniref:Uncharacterized protein LOC127142638 n=1 Tax=Lates calcarifer TaxID=8187 RepID=A0AAJ8B751_LATCA|nr:uncharacterized protein LOC127142638 [Lates calcarifer]